MLNKDWRPRSEYAKGFNKELSYKEKNMIVKI
jgi:hypothetical protein